MNDRHSQKLILSPRIPLRRKLDLLSSQITPSERFYLRIIRSKIAHPKLKAAATTGLQELRANRANRKEQNAILAELAARVPEAVIQKMDTPTLTVAAVQKSDEPETLTDPRAPELVRKTDVPSETTSVRKLDKQVTSLARAILGGGPSAADFDTARNLARTLTECRLRYRYAFEFRRQLSFAAQLRAAEDSLGTFLADNPGLAEFAQNHMNTIYESVRCGVLCSAWNDEDYDQRTSKRELRLIAEQSRNPEIRQRALEKISPKPIDHQPRFNPRFLPDPATVRELNELFRTATNSELSPEEQQDALQRIDSAARWLGGSYAIFLTQLVAWTARNPSSAIPSLALFERMPVSRGAFAPSPYPNALNE
jgi:hypothetical protein